MPRGGKCNHPNCDGGPCKQLTPAELEPDTDELALAQQLIDEGWQSVSTNYRRIARLTDRWPSIDKLMRPEALESRAGQELAALWQRHQFHLLRMFASGNRDEAQYVEVRELTVKQFRAFKKLGGRSA